MGDGPGYDYASSRSDMVEKTKRKHQLRRLELLQIMVSEVGFGDNDGDLIQVEKSAHQHLLMAYELLSLVTTRKL